MMPLLCDTNVCDPNSLIKYHKNQTQIKNWFSLFVCLVWDLHIPSVPHPGAIPIVCGLTGNGKKTKCIRTEAVARKLVLVYGISQLACVACISCHTSFICPADIATLM